MGTDKRARQKEMHRTRAEQARKDAESLARRRLFVNISLIVVAIAALVVGILVFTGDDDTNTDTADGVTTTSPDQSSDENPDGSDVPDSTVEDVPTTTVAVGTAPCPETDGSSDQMKTFDGPPEMCIDPSITYTAEVETNIGNFTMQFDAERAPLTVNNFVFLARYHYFDGVGFHRIIKDFVIQGGDPEGTGMGGPGYKFPDELPQAGEYQKYSLAMANSGPDTNGSQFFIITGDQGIALPPSYSLFGEVVDGTDVIDKMANAETAEGDMPVDELVMKKVTIVEG